MMKTCDGTPSAFDLSANDEMLCDLAQDEFVFLPPLGNAGDGVIAYATYRALAKSGCRYRMIEVDAPPTATRDRTVVVCGGGNLVPLYRRVSDFILKHHRGAKRIVVLPSTIRGNVELIKTACNVTYYCRDQESLEHVRSISPAADAKFAHDMALMLDLDELAADSKNWHCNSFSPRRFNRLVIRPFLASLTFRRNQMAPDSLSAFRLDPERTGQSIPKSNLDVSGVLGRSRNFTEAESRVVTGNMVRFLSRFSEVDTNRLHVAITAGLLGLRVNLFDNSYGKNRAVYQSSLNQRFELMRFCGLESQATTREAA